MSTQTCKIQEFEITSLTAFLPGPDSSSGLALTYNGDKSYSSTYYTFQVATLSYGGSVPR